MREDETPEPEDLPDLEDERAFANAVIVEGMKRNPERAREVIAQVTHTFAESGRYSAEEVRAAVDELRSFGNGDGPREHIQGPPPPSPGPADVSDHKRQGALGYRLPEGTVPTPDGGMTVV